MNDYYGRNGQNGQDGRGDNRHFLSIVEDPANARANDKKCRLNGGLAFC